jgi:1-acyl-sn-glycerol-3-phosphate acyltransferase
MLYAVVKAIAVGLMRLLFRIEARDPGRVPAAGPVLLVSNHSSVLDPPLIGGASSRQLSFLAKAELFRVPVFGALLRRLGARPLRRAGSDPAAMRTALRVLEEGGALLVFPEGTRGPEGVLRPAKAGAGMLAVVSGASVVPVYVSGSGRAWPKGARLPRPTRVTVAFGEPLRFDAKRGGDRREQYEAAGRAMMAAIARLKDHVESPGTARPRPKLHVQIQ